MRNEIAIPVKIVNKFLSKEVSTKRQSVVLNLAFDAGIDIDMVLNIIERPFRLYVADSTNKYEIPVDIVYADSKRAIVKVFPSDDFPMTVLSGDELDVYLIVLKNEELV